MHAKAELQKHIDQLFEKAPRSRAAFDLQEELLCNSIERYNDLIAGGMSEEAAFNAVVGSIGDVEELIRALPGEGLRMDSGFDDDRRFLEKRARVKAIAVGLYIMAAVVFFICAFIAQVFWTPALIVGLILMGLICITSTCMLVYQVYSAPRYVRRDDSVVEEFKAWKSDTRVNKTLMGAISAILWIIFVIAYFAISFLTKGWAYSWLIFLVGVCAQVVIVLVFKLKELRK